MFQHLNHNNRWPRVRRFGVAVDPYTGTLSLRARIVLKSAVLSGVTFGYSNLARADLRGVDLADSDFTGSYLFLTRLEGADLTKTKGLKEDQLAIACGSAETQLPSGIAAPKSWPCPDYDAE